MVSILTVVKTSCTNMHQQWTHPSLQVAHAHSTLFISFTTSKAGLASRKISQDMAMHVWSAGVHCMPDSVVISGSVHVCLTCNLVMEGYRGDVWNVRTCYAAMHCSTASVLGVNMGASQG